jgi:hypothetical protein
VSKTERSEGGIEGLLRRSMAAPIPNLPPDFGQRVLRRVRGRSLPLDRYGQTLITSYGLVSVVVCTVLMRGQGLGWGTVGGMILGPVALFAATRPLWWREKRQAPN